MTNKIKVKNYIGILSLFEADNYGAVLQGYSLYSFCKSMSLNIEMINYFPDFMVGRYKYFYINTSNIKSFIGSIIFSTLALPIHGTKKLRFALFRRKINRSRRFYSNTMNDEYNTYIVGSDQVWNTSITNHDYHFMLDYVKDRKKKNSYAASIGKDKFDDNEKIVHSLLASFNNLSVREKKARDYLAKNYGLAECKVNIDPVFLTSKDKWRCIARNRLIKTHYLLIYTFAATDEAISHAEEITKETGLKSILLQAQLKKYYNGVQTYRAAGPREFLSLLYYADYIITDSFHGTAFSLIFHKNFSVIPYSGTNERINNVLRVTGVIKEHNEINGFKRFENIDYNAVDIQIEKEIQKSREYLGHILSK